jgi:hypothetical protein
VEYIRSMLMMMIRADSWQQAFGDAFVPNYSAVGYRIFDVITNGTGV